MNLESKRFGGLDADEVKSPSARDLWLSPYLIQARKAAQYRYFLDLMVIKVEALLDQGSRSHPKTLIFAQAFVAATLEGWQEEEGAEVSARDAIRREERRVKCCCAVIAYGSGPAQYRQSMSCVFQQVSVHMK